MSSHDKNKSIRSVETNLERLTLVVAENSADACHFFAFSDLTCHIDDTGIAVFWLHCRLIVRRPNLQAATKRLLYQQVKIPG